MHVASYPLSGRYSVHTSVVAHCLPTQKALLSDVGATRDLCVQLERSKESLTVQLSTQSLHYDQVRAQV